MSPNDRVHANHQSSHPSESHQRKMTDDVAHQRIKPTGGCQTQNALTVLSLTYNCGGVEPPPPAPPPLPTSNGQQHQDENKRALLVAEIRRTVLSHAPDLVSVNLQECCPLGLAAFPNSVSDGYGVARKGNQVVSCIPDLAKGSGMEP